MNKTILICTAAAALCWTPALAASGAETIIALERQAMDGWQKGDPEPALALFDADVTYFHAVSDKRVEGLAAVKALCEGYRGRPLFDSYEMAGPKVQQAGDIAVLTYQLVTRNGDLTRRWNATEVFQRKKEGWRVIHSHFSLVRPPA